MGYESRIYIMRRNEIINEYMNKPHIYYDNIAKFDLRKLGYDHGGIVWRVFTKPIDFDFYANGDDPTREDAYGKPLKYCGIKELNKALLEYYEKEKYRRIPPLIACLSALIDDSDAWTDGELIAVHYGY